MDLMSAIEEARRRSEDVGVTLGAVLAKECSAVQCSAVWCSVVSTCCACLALPVQ